MARLIDTDDLEEKGVQFTDTNVYIPIEAVWNAPTVDAVVLPCKLGEKVYCILHNKSEIVEDVVEDYDIWSIKNGIKIRLSLLNHKDYVIGEFGKTVFQTREEAEAALAKMKEG